MAAKLPSPEYVRNLLFYDLSAECLRYRKRPLEHFTQDRHAVRPPEVLCRMWNKKYAGKQLSTQIRKGRPYVLLRGNMVRIDKVLHVLKHGEWPT